MKKVIMLFFLLLMTGLSSGCKTYKATEPIFSSTALVSERPTETPTETITHTPNPSLTPTTTPSLTPTSTPTPTPTSIGGGTGRIIFSLERDDFVPRVPDLNGNWNVFILNINGGKLTPLTDGWSEKNRVVVQDVSPDGEKLLISATIDDYGMNGALGNLYLANIDGSDLKLLHTRHFFMGAYDCNSAYFSGDGEKIIYLAEEGEERYIFQTNSDRSDAYKISNPGSYPLALYPTGDHSSVYWQAGCPGENINYSCGHFKTILDDLYVEKIWDSLHIYSISSRANKIIADDYESTSKFVSNIDESDKLNVDFEGGRMTISPDGRKVIVYKSSEDEYLDVELWTIPDLVMKKSKYKPDDPALKFFQVNILYAWSPDGKLVLSESGVMLDVESMEIFELPFNFRPFFLQWIP